MLAVWYPLIKDNTNQSLVSSTISNSAILASDGKLGGCYKACREKAITINYTITETDNFSYAFWFKLPSAIASVGKWQPFLRISTISNGTAGDAIVQWASYNQLKFYESSGHDQMLWQSLTYDVWHHLVVVHSPNKCKIYIDGELETRDYTMKNLIKLRSGNIELGWGIDTSAPVGFSDIRIYTHALSPKEIRNIASALVLHYPLNDAACSKNLASNTDWERTSNNEYMRILDSYQDAGTGEYTFSCEMKVASGTPSSMIYWSDGDYTTKYYYSVSDIYTNGVLNGKLSQQWQKVVCKLIFTIFAEDSTVMPHISTYYTYGSGAIVSVRNPKLEKGWNPNPVYTNSSYNIVYDCSGYQNNGTINGSLSCSSDSPRYKISTHFTSSIPSRIMLPSDMSCLSGNNEQTLSCWVKSSGLGSGMVFSGLISLGYGNTLFLSDSDYQYRIDNSSDLDDIWANQNPHDGKWHLVTATYKSGVASIYIDGVLKNSVSRTFSNRYINNGGNCIGTEVNNDSICNLNGDISDIRMYTTALSADDIKELYNTSAYVSDNGTLLTYSVEE